MIYGALILVLVSEAYTIRAYAQTPLVKQGNPQWDNLSSPPGAKAPAKRTGHVMVTYDDKLFL